MKKIEWVKNFGIKADVITILALAEGQLGGIKKLYGLPNCLDYKYVDGEESRDKKYLENLNSIVGKNLKSWIRKIVSKLDRVNREFEKFCERKADYAGLTNRELWMKFEKFYQKYSFFLGVCDTPVFVEEAVSKAILEELGKKGVADLDRQFKVATTYLGESYAVREEKDLLKIAMGFKKKDFSEKIKRHKEKYDWMGFRITIGKKLDAKYFTDRMKKEATMAAQKLEEISRRQRENRKNYNKLVSKHRLDEKLLRCAQDLIWIRDKRYVGLTRGTCRKRDLFSEMAKRLNVRVDDVLFLPPDEIKRNLMGGQPIKRKIIGERKKGFAILCIDGKIKKIVIGGGLKKIKKEKIEDLKIIRGVSANRGKVRGKVRVVLEDADIKKFKKGEILVTNMTSPDYVGIMKNASAVVTDLGGITCHAAIISRELNIPCVIGTQIATRVLKTGDLAGVDAGKGVVRVMEKI